MMDVDFLPRHLVIVGGSYIGLEFGQMFRRFGSEVTIVEMAPRLIAARGRGRLGGDPGDPRAGRHRHPPERQVHQPVAATAPDVVAPASTAQEGAPEVAGSHLLLAVGRRPNTDDLGLDKAGVAIDERGYIAVDDELRTNVPGHLGARRLQRQGRVHAHRRTTTPRSSPANLLDNDRRRVSDRIPTYALFIDPPLGRAGMTEAEVAQVGQPRRWSASAR